MAFWGILSIWQSLSKQEKKPHRILIFLWKGMIDISSFEGFAFPVNTMEEI